MSINTNLVSLLEDKLKGFNSSIYQSKDITEFISHAKYLMYNHALGLVKFYSEYAGKDKITGANGNTYLDSVSDNNRILNKIIEMPTKAYDEMKLNEILSESIFNFYKTIIHILPSNPEKGDNVKKGMKTLFNEIVDANKKLKTINSDTLLDELVNKEKLISKTISLMSYYTINEKEFDQLYNILQTVLKIKRKN